MKKSIPFNTLINQSNIVEVVGEWLYNYPSFLQNDEGVKPEDAATRIDDLSKATKDKIVARAAIEFTRARDAQQKAADALEKASKTQETAEKDVDNINVSNITCHERKRLERALANANFARDTANAEVEEFDQYRDAKSHFLTEDTIKVTIVDTPKSKQKNKERAERNTARCVSSHELWEKLSLPRKGEEAKKRLIWVSKAEDTQHPWEDAKERQQRLIRASKTKDEVALVCYVTSAEEEKQFMLDFFDRHYNFDKWFFDDTNMALNVWTTELHLSFYQPLTSDDQEPQGGLSLPGTLGFPFARASMGFMFYGDFFDRYWTCHFIESTHATDADPFREWLETYADTGSTDERSKSQRKVLELKLVGRILTEIINSTVLIFTDVKTRLCIGGNLDPGSLFLSTPSSDAYFESSRQWETSQHLLRIVEADLSTVLEKVAKWEMREKDRGQERPRWTHKDESKYGRDLSKLSILINGKIEELKNCCTSIKSLKETVDATQANKRDDLSLRGSENIRIFTYVTVVFLPLGFAATIFSVEHAAVGHLVICAVIALVITVVALFNAATVNRVYERAAKESDKYYTLHMNASYLKQALRDKQDRLNKQRELAKSSSPSAEASPPPKVSLEKLRDPPVISGPWHSCRYWKRVPLKTLFHFSRKTLRCAITDIPLP